MVYCLLFDYIFALLPCFSTVSPFSGGGSRRGYPSQHAVARCQLVIRSISEISSCCLGPRPWHIEIRHRVKKTSTIDLFGFETLKIVNSKIEIMETDHAANPRTY